MVLVATPKTAAMAGIVTGIGGTMFEAFTRLYPSVEPLTRNYVLVGVMLVFFFPWVFAFVFGKPNRTAPVRAMPAMMMRGVIWLVCAGLVIGIGLPLTGLLVAH